MSSPVDPSRNIPQNIHRVDNSDQSFFKDEGISSLFRKIEKVIERIFITIMEFWYNLTHSDLPNIHAQRPSTPIHFPEEIDIDDSLKNASNEALHEPPQFIASNNSKSVPILGELAQSFNKYPLDENIKTPILWSYYQRSLPEKPQYKIYEGYTEGNQNPIERFVFDENNQLIQYISNENPQNPLNYQYTPANGMIYIKDAKKPKAHKLEYPWAQDFAFSFTSFLESKEHKKIIQTVQPNEDHSVQALEIEKLGEEELLFTRNNTTAKIKTIKIEITPSQWGGSTFWKATLCFDAATKTLISQTNKARGPGRNYEPCRQINSL